LSRYEIMSIAGIRPGNNILVLNLRELTEKLESDRRIKQATVIRTLPNQVAIKVGERREFLRVKIPREEGILVMDEEGYLLGPATKDSREMLFQDLRPEAKNFFKRGRYQDIHLLKVLFSIKGIVEKDPLLRGKKIAGIDFHSADRIHILFEDGFELRVGKDYGRDLGKLEVMRSMIEKDLEYLEYLDLRFQNVAAKKRDKRKR